MIYCLECTESFRTVSVDIYLSSDTENGMRITSFRTVSVDIYLHGDYTVLMVMTGFRTVSVDIYQPKKIKVEQPALFSYSIC